MKYFTNNNIMMKAAFVLAVVGVMLPSKADGFAIRVDAHEEECFYETVTAGTKVSIVQHLSCVPVNFCSFSSFWMVLEGSCISPALPHGSQFICGIWKHLPVDGSVSTWAMGVWINGK